MTSLLGLSHCTKQRIKCLLKDTIVLILKLTTLWSPVWRTTNWVTALGIKTLHEIWQYKNTFNDTITFLSNIIVNRMHRFIITGRSWGSKTGLFESGTQYAAVEKWEAIHIPIHDSETEHGPRHMHLRFHLPVGGGLVVDIEVVGDTLSGNRSSVVDLSNRTTS